MTGEKIKNQSANFQTESATTAMVLCVLISVFKSLNSNAYFVEENMAWACKEQELVRTP